MSHSTLGLFDSLVAVHQSTPDTGLLRRLYPPRDSLLYVQGGKAFVVSGDSLLRRTLSSHTMVRAMAPAATERRALVVDRNTVVLNAIWTVDVVDTSGAHHPWQGPITLVASRAGPRWVIRAHRE